MLRHRRGRLQIQFRVLLQRDQLPAGSRSERTRMPTAGLHAWNRVGRDRGGGPGRSGAAAAMETVDNDTRQTGVCPFREGEDDGQVGHGTIVYFS